MTRIPLEQAFEVCQKSKTTWLNGKASLAKAEMALKEFELSAPRLYAGKRHGAGRCSGP